MKLNYFSCGFIVKLLKSLTRLSFYASPNITCHTHLVIVAKNPTETLHIRPDHLPPEVLVHHVHIKLVLVISLFPAFLPQPAAQRQRLFTEDQLTQAFTANATQLQADNRKIIKWT